MNPERWPQVKALFHAALERPSEQRAAYLVEACAGDEPLRHQVEALLAAHEEAGSFIESPAYEAATGETLLTDDGPTHARDTLSGQSIGRYQILAPLGRGGMGVVYRAFDTTLDRPVALKLLPSDLSSNEDRLRRFVQEAKTASALNHPNILTVYEIGHTDTRHFIATELIEGITLRERMTNGRMKLDEVLDVGAQVSSALAAAHASGIVHRDIKPENIMLRADGYVKVLDFGLAKLVEGRQKGHGTKGGAAAGSVVQTTPGMLMGTVAYMSPEQARGLAVDARTDIWSLGVVLYEMVAGIVPFSGATISDVLVSVLEREPTPLVQFSAGVPVELERVIIRALTKDRAARYQTVEDLAQDLKRLRQETADKLLTTPMVSQAKLTRPLAVPRRRLFALGAGSLAILAIFIAAAAGYLMRGRPFWQTRDAAQVSTNRDAQTTLAVLPFHPLNAVEEIDFLGIGIPDAIITRLANVPQMRLRPTSSILRYEHQLIDNPQEVGRTLASDYLVTGTMLKAGEQFRVNVQLVRVSDGTPLWGRNYNMRRADLLSLQDTIAKEVAAALQLKLSPAEQTRYSRYTENATAYELYLRGRTNLVRYTKEGTLAAIKSFEEVLRLEPDYALAHAGLAMASAQMRLRFAPEAEFQSWGERAKQEANRALQLDGNLAEAHEALAALYRTTEFDWERTIEESRRALELNPNLEQPHYYMAGAFYHLGLLEQIEDEVRAGVEINPGNRIEPLRVRGSTELFSGRYTESAALFEQAQALSEAPVTDWYLAHAYYYKGERERAEAMLVNLRGNSAQAEQRAHATLASFLAARKERTQAETQLSKVRESSYMDHHVAYALGAAYTQLGDHAKAREWLARAADTGLPCYPWYARDPLLKPLRGDREFQSFMTELQKQWESAKARYAL